MGMEASATGASKDMMAAKYNHQCVYAEARQGKATSARHAPHLLRAVREVARLRLR